MDGTSIAMVLDTATGETAQIHEEPNVKMTIGRTTLEHRVWVTLLTTSCDRKVLVCPRHQNCTVKFGNEVILYSSLKEPNTIKLQLVETIQIQPNIEEIGMTKLDPDCYQNRNIKTLNNKYSSVVAMPCLY